MVKIYDCFMLWNEVEILYMRLDILYEHVDKFVICESKESHSKKVTKSEFVFIKNKAKYEKFMDKIIFLPIEKLPFEGDFTAETNGRISVDNWKNENWQRKYLFKGIEGLRDDDIIAISDLDEIYDPRVLPSVREKILHFPAIGVKMKLFYYYVNVAKKQIWEGSIFVQRGNLPNPDTIQHLRDNRTSLPFYVYGGWHYSWMATGGKIVEKFKVVAEHDIINQFSSEEHIKKTLSNVSDLFDREGLLGTTSVIDLTTTDNIPSNMNKYIEKFPDILYRPPRQENSSIH